MHVRLLLHAPACCLIILICVIYTESYSLGFFFFFCIDHYLRKPNDLMYSIYIFLLENLIFALTLLSQLPAPIVLHLRCSSLCSFMCVDCLQVCAYHIYIYIELRLLLDSSLVSLLCQVAGADAFHHPQHRNAPVALP